MISEKSKTTIMSVAVLSVIGLTIFMSACNTEDVEPVKSTTNDQVEEVVTPIEVEAVEEVVEPVEAAPVEVEETTTEPEVVPEPVEPEVVPEETPTETEDESTGSSDNPTLDFILSGKGNASDTETLKDVNGDGIINVTDVVLSKEATTTNK